MEKALTVTMVGQYDKANINNNKSVDLSFKFSYDERINVIQCIAFVGQNIEVLAKKGADKPVKLGTFSFKELKLDRDGETTLKLNSEVDYVNIENVNEIISKDELIKVRLSANIPLEDANEDGEQ